ncbi:spermine oxidase isoform X3 [Alosa sapidissima]|uniref:spermine oxidase isoform X3 n=1 Tax=Alosa sapidissima TaxID=34773 RepID=UPI001C08AB4C|nr:spermine oxidase isoform X3 [Alosa sapidissima]
MNRIHTAKVVVIGAGFAGIAAAATLFEAGFQHVQVLEAMGRVGGRVYTMRPFGSDIIELGANWIHGQEGNPLFELEDGRLLQAEDVEQVCALFSRLTTRAFDSELEDRHRCLSLGDYLDNAFAESPLAATEDGLKVFEWCKRCECTDEASSSLYEVSASQISHYEALEGGFFNSLGPGGYQAFIDVLLRKLPAGVIMTNTPVAHIEWALDESGKRSTHPVQIVCEHGQSFEADHVIVTVSLGVLKQRAALMFRPPLPNSKMAAIDKLEIGTVDKIYLCFPERFWPEDCAGIQLVWDNGPEDAAVYTSELEGEAWKETWFKKICGFDTVARHPNVLCGWITGREALHMETLEDVEVGDVCMRLLRSFTGWPVPEVSQVLMSRWGRDPYVRGSYTFVPQGVLAEEHGALAAPLPPEPSSDDRKPLQVLFAGEATHVNFYTTTHGAYLTGIREAQRLINLYT